MATTSNQGFLKHTQASGNAIVNVFASLLGDLDTLLRGHDNETHTLDDTENTALFGGAEDDLVISVVNVDDNAGALVHLAGSGGAVTILAQDGTHFNTTKGNQGTSNIYYDTDQYEIENETASDGRTYRVHALGDRNWA